MEESDENKFTKELYEKYNTGKRILLPHEIYSSLIRELKAALSNKHTKSRHGYYVSKKYDILTCGGVEKLIKRQIDPESTPLYYVSIEDTYDVIKQVHIGTGHGGRDRMIKEISQKYANITREAVEIFKSYCKECQSTNKQLGRCRKRKRHKTSGGMAYPTVIKEFASRGKVALIDMQSMVQSCCKWIMVYQDHLTKFVILRALTSNSTTEIANQLLDIFLLFGAPSILQTNNGGEFTDAIINKLKMVWSDLVMVCGNPGHSNIHESDAQANGDIKNMLVTWMADNNTTDWPIGIKFVQFQKNCILNSGIKKSPFTAMFGCEAKVGLSTCSLPSDIINDMKSEDDLLSAISTTTALPAENQYDDVPMIKDETSEQPTLSPDNKDFNMLADSKEHVFPLSNILLDSNKSKINS